MTAKQKLERAAKRHQEMIACVERLKSLCLVERTCERGCPFARYEENGYPLCTLLQMDDLCGIYDVRDWNIKRWTDGGCDEEEAD